MKKLIFTALLGLFSLNTMAQPIMLGQSMPLVSIPSNGELILENKDITYQPWDLRQPATTSHVLQYMAGTISASKLNEPFTDALEKVDPSTVYVTTIINLKDAMWGTKGFVKSEVEKNKRKFPESTLVLDEKGFGRVGWELAKKTSTIVITDSNGVVTYLKHGAMDENEIQAALELIRQQAIASTTEPAP